MTVIHVHKPDGVPETANGFNYFAVAMALNQDAQGGERPVGVDPPK
jgi:hypothetical protein